MTTNTILYQFNYSQDIVHLQTQYSLFNRVSNIVFSVAFDNGFDNRLMEQAVNLLIDRNDCLRLRFIKDGKKIKQYFLFCSYEVLLCSSSDEYLETSVSNVPF